MDQTVERWQCGMCLVHFRVGQKCDGRCEEFRCSTPGCGKRFWAGERMIGTKKLVTMNVEVRPA